MRETLLLGCPPSGGVSRIVIALIDRAENFGSQGSVVEARSAFHAAVVADETPAARLSFAAFLTSHGDWATAERHLRTALDLAHDRGRHDERADCTLALSQVALQRGDDSAANSWLQQAVKWQLLAEGLLSPAVLLQQALLSIRRQCLAEASRLLQSALAIADDSDRPAVILHLGIIDRLRGDYHAALSRLHEALRLFELHNDVEGRAFTLINLGHILHDLGRHDEAVASFDEASHILKSLGQSLRARRAAGFARESRRIFGFQSPTYQLN